MNETRVQKSEVFRRIYTDTEFLIGDPAIFVGVHNLEHFLDVTLVDWHW